MPRRTNKEQRLIFLIKKHLAGEGFVVTESKMLRSVSTRRLREVDVVVEGVVNGEAVVIAFEVRATRRPLDSVAVEGIFGKYDNLPINKCVIVSWSGFTEGALELIEARPQRYIGLRPEIASGSPTLAKFFIDQFQARISLIRTVVETSDGGTKIVRSVPGDEVVVFDAEGQGLGYVEQLAYSLCFSAETKDDFAKAIHQIEDKSIIGGFEYVSQEIRDHGYALRWEDTGELQPISRFGVYGAVKVWQTEVDLRPFVLGDQSVGTATGSWFGNDAVWVASPEADDQLRVSWQTIDPKAALDSLGVDSYTTGGDEAPPASK